LRNKHTNIFASLGFASFRIICIFCFILKFLLPF
jgi:hypothetical protein